MELNKIGNIGFGILAAAALFLALAGIPHLYLSQVSGESNTAQNTQPNNQITTLGNCVTPIDYDDKVEFIEYFNRWNNSTPTRTSAYNIEECIMGAIRLTDELGINNHYGYRTYFALKNEYTPGSEAGLKNMQMIIVATDSDGAEFSNEDHHDTYYIADLPRMFSRPCPDYCD